MIKNYEEQKKEYYLSPNLCGHCKKEIIFEERKVKKFCNSSCAASYNNLKRGPKSSISKEKISLALKGKKYYILIPENEKIELCRYNCGNIANFILRNGSKCCSETSNSCKEIKRKNSESLKLTYKEGRKNKSEFKIKDKWLLSHLTRIENLKSKPFELWGSVLKRKTILEEQNFKCNECRIEEKWNNKSLKFELDHINGDRSNNKRENLRLICPNCHSQTETFCGKNSNKGVGHIKVSDENLVKALKEEKNIKNALEKVGLTPKGANYKRCYELKEKFIIV